MFQVKKAFGPYYAEVQYEPAGMQKMHFDAQFRYTREAEIKAIRARYEAGVLTDEDLCLEVMVGWQKVTDPDTQQPIEFTRELLETLLNDWMGLPYAIAATWFKVVRFGAKKI